ncbi:TIGR02996 domain-containing protein [Pyxidicoccus sp. MSG2]|uniref:TIGR02996 domain-containing protein n=1 Tax=Pyxidicoccus sp. MSG2 TaxID=2996790 RepID=UPI002271D3A3|nr:TIGR02996 domain-containing protein [Pyxidicoccus sp. MSG2]MCY1014946.1 TIGR02996 domain-containing protein [Pyxidicoccus sp. MSG2]
MARFELRQGDSGEFWEIHLDWGGPLGIVTTYRRHILQDDVRPAVLTTRWGRIGTEGEAETRQVSRVQAHHLYSELIREKQARGFTRVKGVDTGPAPKSHPELEAAILHAPEAAEGYLVYGDWLQAQGDPHGELIAIQHALFQAYEAISHDGASGEEARRLELKVAEVLRTHWGVLLGHALADANVESMLSVWWRLGFIHGARVENLGRAPSNAPSVEEVLELLLAHPSARFLQELTLGPVGSRRGDHDFQPLIRVIAKAAPRALRTLVVGDVADDDPKYDSPISSSFVGDLTPLYPALPQLRSLRLVGREIKLGAIDLPELRTFRLESTALSREAVRSIAGASWPKLERLAVWFGSRAHGAGGGVDDLQPLLDARGVPELRHLGLCNATFTDALCEALPQSKVLEQLHTLDLSKGTMTEAGAERLVANAAAFKHLKRLIVTENLLGSGAVEQLAKLCPDVQRMHQRSSYFREVSVTE